MKKFFNYLRKKHFRLIDSHIGIVGAHLFVKVLAVYGSTTVYLLQVSTMRWFSFCWEYHFSSKFYPNYTCRLSIFTKILFDTGKDAARLTSESVKKWTSESDAKKEAAKARIKDIDPEAASYIIQVYIRQYYKISYYQIQS